MRLILVLFSTFLLLNCVSEAPRREVAASKKILDASGYLYDPSDRSCDGYPRLSVETMPGTCLGLVLPRSRAVDKASGKALAMPRTILQLQDSEDFLLVDMGGWKANNGGIYLLHGNGGQGHDVIALKTGLNMPHGLAYGPDGYIYVGETHQISRFHYVGGKIADWQVAIGEIPRFKGYMHPLTQFAFSPKNGDMFVNAGAPTDHCYAKEYGTYVDCPESSEMGLGAIFRYPGTQFKHIPKGGLIIRDITAMGLRNSMAMAVSPEGFLIQGENGRDFPEMDEPYEEINVINPTDKGRNHGWPQCYNFHATSPEWIYDKADTKGLKKRFATPLNCDSKGVDRASNYKKPQALIPPHAAPLHMGFYHGKMFGDLLDGKLLVTWHGYQPTGHRLVAYNVDQFGRPIVKAPDEGAYYMVDQRGSCPVKKKFTPKGGLDQYAPYTEVISGWDEKKGIRPKGAPVAFTVAHDGSIYIVEDRENHTVVRLARSNDAPHADDCLKVDKNAVDPRMELLAWRSAVRSQPESLAGYNAIHTQLIQQYCVTCHGGFKEKDIALDDFSVLDYMVKNGWFAPGKHGDSKIYSAISQDGRNVPMPPLDTKQFLSTKAGDDLLKIVREWIDKLPKDVDSSYTRIEVGSARAIRATASSTGAECGQLQKGDAIYVDPRPATRPVKDGWLWTKIYLVPRDSRLFAGKCAYPEDGVFYVALKKN